ncbi:CPBP family intramembrane metalloprotease [Streptomyces sp. MB09-01]|uniref:CPBP family intramembrane glutamic endopeptidase n=1 Tax=Streptomyces sp. MB09-01 TaxID=3028666 RepID=UPI0029A83732|nr:CPBP family intramembrane glutamic endopeptidase [Streptomyces sp. MB09-01]MDX3538522.1 CPBP family intramembrane metalloprotease [Streptomyces sp. MB09-01]
MTNDTTALGPARAFPPGSGSSRPLPFHRLALATGYHSWWRPLAGTALVLLGVVVMMPALFLGAEIVGRLVDRPLDPDGMAVWGDIGDTALALLSIAVMTPVVLLAAYSAQRRPAGTVSSVEGRLRRRRLATCLALALPLVLLMVAVQALMPGPAGEGEDLAWAGTSTFLTGLATVWLLVPFQAAAEEYVFRGWLLQAVGSWCRSPWAAIAPQALLFAAAHGWGTVWGFADLVVFGVVTGWLTIRTGGLEAAIALHVLNNLVGMSIAAAFAGAFASQETAADMDGVAMAVDVPMVLLYAAAVLWVTRRRERATDTDTPGGPDTSPPAVTAGGYAGPAGGV